MRKVVILILLIMVAPLYGFNSLVRHEDISKMKELGISQEVIQYFITNQTSSISSEDVIKMKQSGLAKQYQRQGHMKYPAEQPGPLVGFEQALEYGDFFGHAPDDAGLRQRRGRRRNLERRRGTRIKGDFTPDADYQQ